MKNKKWSFIRILLDIYWIERTIEFFIDFNYHQKRFFKRIKDACFLIIGKEHKVKMNFIFEFKNIDHVKEFVEIINSMSIEYEKRP